MTADDPLAAYLAEVGERQQLVADPGPGFDRISELFAARKQLCHQDVPRLLAAVRLLLGYHAAYLTPEERAALTAELTGGAGRG